jgi:hypothetical protein
MQVVAPRVTLYVPAAHVVHTPLPAVPENFPFGQMVHVEAPARVKKPAGHDTPAPMPPAGQYVPAPQRAQVSGELEDWNVPAGHEGQLVAAPDAN